MSAHYPRTPPPPPPPLRYQNRSKPSLSNTHSNSPLLYDLPPSTPPASPTVKSGVIPHTATPTHRNRSTTPLRVSRSELQKFADHCHAWYFNQDELSGKQVAHTLGNVPDAQRAPYSRLQASIRSYYHQCVNSRRHAEFLAHINATQPGGSLMPHSRTNPSGSVAKKERFERLDRFVKTWCTMGMPGTTPFFEALWAIMRLQVVPHHLGGAGPNRLYWEFDDAVFKESAGKDFMLDAIDVLKGVLAFEEISSSKHKSNKSSYQSPSAHSRGRSQPLLDHHHERSFSNASPISQTTRTRASSDPFLDMPTLSQSFPHSLPSAPSQFSATIPSSEIPEAPSPATLLDQEVEKELLPPLPSDLVAVDDEDYMRIWTSPDLPNPELLSLLTVFPTFITRRALPRFPVPPNPRAADIEEGDTGGGKHIQFGTGSMWISSMPRSDGWRGDWWTRLVLWWRRLFC